MRVFGAKTGKKEEAKKSANIVLHWMVAKKVRPTTIVANPKHSIKKIVLVSYFLQFNTPYNQFLPEVVVGVFGQKVPSNFQQNDGITSKLSQCWSILVNNNYGDQGGS